LDVPKHVPPRTSDDSRATLRWAKHRQGEIQRTPHLSVQLADSVNNSRANQFALNYSTRHLRFGWWALAIYVCLGIVLEMMHGFKIGWYLDVGNETRRLMFSLGHFHGTMLALVNIAAGLTIRSVDDFKLRPSVSFALIWAAILLPGGFLLGGFFTYDGDPGTAVWLVPIGALLMLYGVGRVALDLTQTARDAAPSRPKQ
jgi:hypothetical protein